MGGWVGAEDECLTGEHGGCDTQSRCVSQPGKEIGTECEPCLEGYAQDLTDPKKCVGTMMCVCVYRDLSDTKKCVGTMMCVCVCIGT